MKVQLKYNLIIASIAILLIFNSCEKETENITEGPHVVVSLKDDPYCKLESYAYTVSYKYSRQLAKQNNLNDLLPFIQYDVSVHHFSYYTTYKDSTVLASGAICIPLNLDNPRLMSYQHGTIFYEDYAPSEFHELSTWAMEFTATNGFITFVPDYIGYGTSKKILHPFHLYTPTVDAVIDMIIEGEKFLNNNKIDYDTSGLFLAGFSEGGYATFAVQKEIETHPEYKLKIKASAPGDGAYDLCYMFELATQNDYYPSPGYMGLAIAAYNRYYWNYDLEYFFNENYIDEIETIFDGSYTEDEVHNQLPKSLSQLFNQDFLYDFHNNPDNIMRKIAEENSLNSWILNTPTRFIHGENDKIVPFSIAQKTYDDLIALGVNPDKLKLITFEGGHNALKYMPLMLEWFDSLNN